MRLKSVHTAPGLDVLYEVLLEGGLAVAELAVEGLVDPVLGLHVGDQGAVAGGRVRTMLALERLGLLVDGEDVDLMRPDFSL